MQQRNPMQSREPGERCGARKRDGEPCRTRPMPNGRCRMHGGKAGRFPTTGRRSAYTQAFGGRFLALALDPDLLKADVELALFDTFLLERGEVLRAGFSAAWVRDLADATQAATVAQEAGDAEGLDAALTAMRRLTDEGGSQQAAWEDLLAAAKSRAEIALRADATAARREKVVTDRDIAAMFCRWVEITARICGDPAARQVWDTFGRECIRPAADRDPGELVN